MTLALVYWDLTPWLGIPLGVIMGAVAAVIIGTPTFRLRGHYFALSMLAYPLAILYFMQYFGFQEVSLPMHRENPAAYLEFSDPRLLHHRRRGPAGHQRDRLHPGGKLALRPGAAGDPAERTGGRGGGHRCQDLEDARADRLRNDRRRRRRSLRLRSVGGDAGLRVRDAGLRAAGGDDAVRRRRLAVGSGDRRGVPGAAVETAGRLRGRLSARHSGRGLRGAVIAIILAAPDGLYWTLRDRFFRPKAPAPIPAAFAPGAKAAVSDASSGTDADERRGTCRNPSAACARSAMSALPSATAKSWASSARTARARQRCSTC